MKFMEAKKMLKVALVGVGNISGAHIPAWRSMENVDLVALCDIRSERMEYHENVRKYTDFDEMLNNEKIDILDICLPTYLHADYSIKALDRGINVICEKPVSLKKEDVKRIYGAAQRNNVKFMIAQVLRFWPEYEYIKNLYETEKYGKLLSGSMNRLGCYPTNSWEGWMMDKERSGLVPFDLHIHDLDFIIYAFGNPNKISNFRIQRPEQDSVDAVYKYDGFFINTQASWYASPYPFQMSFLFQFENAVAAMEDNQLTIYERDGKIFKPFDTENEDSGVMGLPKSDAYANEIMYFADCVENDKPVEKVKPEQLEDVLDILLKI